MSIETRIETDGSVCRRLQVEGTNAALSHQGGCWQLWQSTEFEARGLQVSQAQSAAFATWLAACLGTSRWRRTGVWRHAEGVLRVVAHTPAVPAWLAICPDIRCQRGEAGGVCLPYEGWRMLICELSRFTADPTRWDERCRTGLALVAPAERPPLSAQLSQPRRG